MHRLIMNSETYQMASSFSQPLIWTRIPTNVYLWRFPLRRLEAEAIRDVILSASGQDQPGGRRRAVLPVDPQVGAGGLPAGQVGADQGRALDLAAQRILLLETRVLKYPMFEVYDQPDLERHLREAKRHHRSDAGAHAAEQRVRAASSAAFRRAGRARGG